MKSAVIALLATALVLSIVAAAHALGAPCPAYSSIAQPQVQNFNKTKYQGIWYEVAIYDPTQPKICHCARLNWTLSDKGAEFVDDYSANCHGYKINIPLHGYTGTNASEPGNQREGFELWMTSPNMVFNLTISEGGEYEMAMVFSCLGLLGNVFQLLSRDPYVSNATIQTKLDEAWSLNLPLDRSKVFIVPQTGCW